MFIFVAFIYITALQNLNVIGHVSKCVAPGVKCADCQRLIHCVKTPDGYQSHNLSFCDNSLGQYCSVNGGGCVNDSKVCKVFGLEQFNCQTVGIFPDPYNCAMYHICTELEDGSFESEAKHCSSERSYDSLTSSCRFKSTHRNCIESPVPKCVLPFQTDALADNGNIYYICVMSEDGDLNPYLYTCKPGQIYFTHECAENFNFTCAAIGKFRDYDNCNAYFDCTDKLKFLYKICRPGSHFDENTKSCVQGPCEDNKPDL